MGQDDRTFWQKLFGKKSEQIDVEEPKNSQDSLAILINNHLEDKPEVNGDKNTVNTDVITENPQLAKKGMLNIIMDDRMSTWLDTVSKSEPRGFRIQVYMGDLTESRRIRSAMLSAGERATLDYNSSDYYVRIGDYRTYIEAEKRLSDLRKTYPTAYVVKDKINLGSY